MLVMVVLVAVAVVAIAVAWAVVNGESWEERGNPEPEVAGAEIDAGDAAALAPATQPAPAKTFGLLTTRTEPGARARRRIRFEDAFDLTTPLGPPEGDAELDGDLAPIGADGYGPPQPELAEEHIPLATRVSGALRLLLLVAVAAGLVTLAVVGTGYLLSERVVSDLGR